MGSLDLGLEGILRLFRTVKYLPLLALLALLTSCSPPNLEVKSYQAPLMELDADEELSFDEDPLKQKGYQIAWNGLIQTDDFLEALDLMGQEAQRTKNKKLMTQVTVLSDRFYSTPQTAQSVSIEKTPYIEMLMAKALPKVQKSVNELDVRLTGDIEKLKTMITRSSEAYPWPKTATMNESIQAVHSYALQVMANLNGLNLHERLREPIRTALQQQIDSNLKDANRFSAQMQSVKTLKNAINTAEEMITFYNIDLTPETKKIINDGKNLSAIIEDVHDGKTALKAIVEIWLMLDQQQREAYVKPISADIFNFLNGKGQSGLDCLRGVKGCPLGPEIVKKLFVIPKVKKYGIVKLKEDLNLGTYQFVNTFVDAEIVKFLPTLAPVINEQIALQFAEQRKELDVVKNDVPGYVRGLILKWADKNLDKSSLNSYENAISRITIRADRKVSFKALSARTAQQGFSTSTAAIGTGFSVSSQLWTTKVFKAQKFRRTVIEQFNKFLGFGGVEVKPKEIRQGLVRSISNTSRPFNLQSSLSNTMSFGMEDVMPLTSAYARQRTQGGFTMTAKAQSKLFDGLVQQMEYYRDWKRNDFETYLGGIDAGEILDPTGPKVGEKLFDKKNFFLLSFAHVGSILKNALKENTQFVQITSNGQVIPANRSNESGEPVTMAAVVDIQNGERVMMSSPADVARWNISVTRFMKAIEGLENTKVMDLKRKGDGGKSIIEEINGLKPYFKDMIFAMGSFIASQAVDANNLVVNSVDLITKEKIVDRYDIQTQLLSIEALLNSYDATNVKAHLSTAFGIYKSMIASFNNETVYFDFAGRAPNLLEASRMVRVFSRLRNYLNPVEQASLDSRLKIWQSNLVKMN